MLFGNATNIGAIYQCFPKHTNPAWVNLRNYRLQVGFSRTRLFQPANRSVGSNNNAQNSPNTLKHRRWYTVHCKGTNRGNQSHRTLLHSTAALYAIVRYEAVPLYIKERPQLQNRTARAQKATIQIHWFHVIGWWKTARSPQIGKGIAYTSCSLVSEKSHSGRVL